MEVKKKTGRHKLQLNERQIRELASLGCTMSEIASVIGCHVDTLRDNFSTALEEGKEIGKVSLRKAQWKLALSGNCSMLQWLGRFYLGQKDELVFTSNEPDVRKLLEQWEVTARKKGVFSNEKNHKTMSIEA